MSIRAIWIISLSADSCGKVFFFRTFSTVEQRARKLNDSAYVVIPSPEEFSLGLLIQLGLKEDTKQFIKWRDSASRAMKLPVIEMKCGEKNIKPVLIIEQNSIIVCCLPLAEDLQKEQNVQLVNMPSISVGFTVLLGILTFLGPSPRNELASKFIELDNYLTLSMPFGTPFDTEPHNVITSYSLTSSSSVTKKLPAWKPINHKGKALISVRIAECVRSVQSDQPWLQTTVDVYGNVSVKAELEGLESDVSLSLTHADPMLKLQLDSLIIHPCVQTYPASVLGGVNLSRRLRFSPPMYRFPLCYYRAASVKHPPIFGIFKLRGDYSVELLIQLKLNENVKNNFDFCDAVIPFFHCGPIQKYEFKSTHGSLQLSEDKHSLKWSIGSKFPSKNLEAVLTAKVELADSPLSSYNDPLCFGKSCYTQIMFKQIGSTLSGCNIDPKSVTTSSANKVKVSVESILQSTEYRIWNSYGDLPFPVAYQKDVSL